MKLSEALNCLGALGAMDGHQKIIKDGGVEKPIFVAYKFSPNTRMAIARNMAKLSSEQKAYGDARNGFIRQISGGSDQVPNDKIVEFRAYEASLLENECQDLGLSKLTIEDLNLSVNEDIPPSLLMALLPILEE